MASAAAGGWTDERSAAGDRNPWAIVAVISIATFMEVLDTSIANVSLTNIAGGLSVSLDQATWVLTSYLVSNAIVIPISGWLSDVIGRKRYYMLSVALFTAASLLCGLAPNIQVLVIARILQGIGGGGLAPSEQSILADTFPPAKRGQAFAAYAIVVVVGPVLGPTLGGYITDNISWHWIFLINVPIGIGSLLLVNTFVCEPEALKKERAAKLKSGLSVDWVGFLLIAIGLGCLEVTLDRGEREDWFDSNFILVTAALSATALIALVVWELNRKDPIVNLRLMGNRNFSIALFVMLTTGLILFGTTQLIPQLLQEVLGYSATDAGLAMTVGGIVTIVVMPLVGVLTGKVDTRLLLFPALVVTALALWNLSHFNADISFWDAAQGRLFQAVALPFLFVPINTVAFVGLPKNQTNQASALLNVARNLGGTFGISWAQTLLAQRGQVQQSRIVEGLSPLNPNYNEGLGNIAGLVGQATDANMTQLGILYSQVQKQAQTLAFLDTFHALMIFVIIVAPLTLFLRPPKPGEGGGEGGA
ncbi:DHA2 family efflux MFS transporter permease subunit [Sphingosinicellaceae bacterium]|nr:DHA2 family efflux MFS transporter permease subunit [Sphingosinicellaceae bacterium]